MRYQWRAWASILVILALLLPQQALAIDGVWHAPYGIDDLYTIEATERFPRDPAAGETVYIKLTTWPVEPGQAAWIRWSKNGVAQPDVGAAWKYNSGNNSYWEAALGPFSKGDQITYTVHANKDGTNEKSVGPFSFTVTDWDRVSAITGYTDHSNRVQLSATSASGNHTPAISISFTAADTFRLQMAPNPAQVTFATGLANYTVSADAAKITVATSAITLEFNKNPYRLTVKKADGSVVTQGYDPAVYRNLSWRSDTGNLIHEVSDAFYSPADEKFMGFGGRYNGVLKRGENVDVYVYDQYRNQNDRSYLSVPFFMSTRGYGVYSNSTYYHQFQLATTRTDMLRWVAKAGDRGSAMVDYYLTVGPPRTVLDRYTSITGRPAVPPKWAFGPIMSANEWNTDVEVRDQVTQTNNHNIPHTLLILEQWSDEMTFYIWRGAAFTPQPGSYIFRSADFTFGGNWPDPAGLVNYLHQNGIKVLLWQPPVNKYPEASDYERHDPNAIQQNRNDDDYMVAQGFAVKRGDGTAYRIPAGKWFPNSTVPDFTRQTAKDWWLAKRQYLLDEIGIDGFKTDGGENIWYRDTVFANGKGKLEMRNQYPLEYIGSFYDFANARKGAGNAMTFSRAGTAGAQRYPCYWAGDQESTWSEFVGQVRAALSAGASGVSCLGWDLAGFSGALPSAELYKRSVAAAAFSPIMQFHSEAANPATSQARSPWNMATQLNDPSIITVYRDYANRRMNLLPYIYSEAIRGSLSGLPLMRPLFLDFPADITAAAQDDEWMFGEGLLAAAVLTQGATQQEVYLPAGHWIDLWNGGQHVGPKTFQYGVGDHGTMPVFVKAGAVLPMNLNSTYQFGGTIGNNVSSYTNLTFAVYPYGSTTYDFYETPGGPAKTISVAEDYENHSVTVGWPALPVPSTMRIFTTRPSAVTVDGASVTQVASLSDLNTASSGWYYDAQWQQLYVKQPSATSSRTLVVGGTDRAAFEAEFGTYNNVSSNTDHAGYTGTGFVDGFETAGDSIEVPVAVREAGTYEVTLRYSAGSGTATRSLYLDGSTRKHSAIRLPGTANWDTWATASFVISLQPGAHRVKVAYDSSDVNPINLDHIAVKQIVAPVRNFLNEEALIGNNWSVGMLDARGQVYDFMYPLGIYKGIVVDGADASGADGVQVNFYQAGVGIDFGGNGLDWLADGSKWNFSQQYVTNTAVLRTDAAHSSLPVTVTQYDFSPRGIAFPNDSGGTPIRGMHVKRVTITNNDSVSRPVDVYYFADFNVNGEAYNDTITYNDTDGALYVTDPGGYGGRTRTISFAVKTKTGGTSTLASQVYPDGAGWLRRTFTIGAGASANFDVITVGASSATTAADLYASHLKPALDWFSATDMGTVQTSTETNWTTLLSNSTRIETPDSRINAALGRSFITALLHFDENTGSIAAGFHNGAYAFNWPRDTVYGAMGFDRMGKHDYAEKVYYWLWNTAERDVPGNDIGNDGVFYRFWYQKYTMDGKREWENPQVDETAIIPFGVHQHYKATGSSTFLDSYYPLARDAALIASEDNPHQGMDYSETYRLMFSMNIWEDMWGMFLYTNAAVVGGLRSAKVLADLKGDGTNATTFQSRADTILNQGILGQITSGDTTNPGMYATDLGRFLMAKDLKKWYTDPSNIINAITTDISMLGLAVPFNILAANDSRVVNTLNELEPALTDPNETGVAVGGAVRYRQDQVSRYGSVYANFGDTYYDGGPWMMATTWLSQYYLRRANYSTGKSHVDKALDYLNWVLDYAGGLGLGAEQVDETKPKTQFAKQAAWPNVWESNGSIVDNILDFLGVDYNGAANTLTARPNIPSNWSYLGGDLVLKDGRFYLRQDRVSTARTDVILTNNSASSLTLDIYIQTDAAPTSVSGATGLTWTYDSATGRVRFQGSLANGASRAITINH